MNAELKQKWVEALRSGKYQQGRQRLHNADDTYCCLGVLCDIVDPEGWSNAPHVGAYSYGGNTMYPPDIFGLDHRFGNILARLNDGVDEPAQSFAQIADYIEANL